MKSKRVGRDGPHAQKLHALRRLPVFVVRPGRMKFYGRFALAPGERTAGEGAAAGRQPWSFSIMMSRMVRSVATMPGLLTRPMLRMACSGVEAQMPSLALTTTPPTAR